MSFPRLVLAFAVVSFIVPPRSGSMWNLDGAESIESFFLVLPLVVPTPAEERFRVETITCWSTPDSASWAIGAHVRSWFDVASSTLYPRMLKTGVKAEKRR